MLEFVADIVIFKSPATGRSVDDAAAWEELAERLRELNQVVRRDDAYMEQGRYGVTWGEMVSLYVGMKAADVVTNHALETLLNRILEVVRRWGRERFEGRRNAARKRPTFVGILDEDGRVLKKWSIGEDGEQESSLTDPDSGVEGPSVDLSPALPRGWGHLGVEPEPEVLIYFRSTHDETHLRADVFVGGDHRLLADLTRLPAVLVISPARGRRVAFQVNEVDDQFGVIVTSEEFRCERIELVESGALQIACYAVD